MELSEKALKARKRFLIEFYNRICNSNVEELCEIPTAPLTLLLDMDYMSLITPLIKEDLLRGKNAAWCAEKFGVGYGCIRGIGANLGTHQKSRKHKLSYYQSKSDN